MWWDNNRVVEPFAFPHYPRRLNDYADPPHGSRAAEFAAALRARVRMRGGGIRRFHYPSTGRRLSAAGHDLGPVIMKTGGR